MSRSRTNGFRSLASRARRAFTLIELLTVIAITAILMTLILVPLIDTFNLTRSAQSWARAQDKARGLTERIAREINQAASVRDNSGSRGEIDIEVPTTAGTQLAGYDTSIFTVRVPIPNAKIDLVEAAAGDPTLKGPGNGFVNPLSGLEDPTLQAPMGQANLPASPGLSLVRYFPGLRDPLRLASNGTGYAGYVEPYTGLLMQRSSQRDNLYVLYRAEVPPMIWSAKLNKFVVNKAFFYDLSRNTKLGRTGPLYDDPSFFDPTVAPSEAPYFNADGTPAYDVPDPDPNAPPDPTKAQMVANWKRIAAIQTEIDRFDMIQPVYDLSTRQVQYVNGAPRLMSLIQFAPSHIGSEPAEGQVAVRLGTESDSNKSYAPAVFQTKYLGWENSVLSFFPTAYAAGNSFEVGLLDPTATGYDVWAYSPTNDGPDPNPASQPKGYMLTDDFYYQDSLTNGVRAPLSRAMNAANSFDMISGRGNWLADANARQAFTGFYGEPNMGRVNMSFGIDEIGICDTNPPFAPTSLPDPVNNPNNLPVGVTWSAATADPSDPNKNYAKTPFNDYPQITLPDGTKKTDLSAGVFSDAQYSTIDRKFNKLWFDYPNLRNQIQRFVDLRVTPNSDGAPSPLNPNPALGFARATIVPGSEQIFGPDEILGPDYGNMVRYYRTTRTPGPNQYRINYTNLPEPDYTLLGLTPPPVNYTPTDLTSAVFQPQYKVGYVEFDSDPNAPLPCGNGTQSQGQIYIYYRFQFTQPGDSMVIDYDSRQLMAVKLTIRDYPQSNQPNPQSVTLYSQAQVRNFLR
ncbi:MAG TPA: prepilin-type N-terminal cleavage/methylation domain-containing protein [Fimbriimonadaceae bacterium]|nr:prepilin-type N-terminal cleavage/methylation domain-containing protein [Fimbriimonadaceae bacterium]